MKFSLRRWGLKMKNNDLYGVKHVYEFTLVQTLKSKYFKTLTIILCALALISMPAVEIITNGMENSAKTSDITKVYIIDESGVLEADYRTINIEHEKYENVKFEYTDKTRGEIEEEIASENNGTIFLHISQDEGSYKMNYFRTPEGKVSEFEVYDLASLITGVYKNNLSKSLGITAEQTAKLEEPIFSEVETYSTETEVDKGVHIDFSQYNIVFVFLMIAIMLVSYGGQGIASSIVTEKSTNLVEILLTSIRPMAVIIGKIFAMLTTTLMQMVLLLGCLGLSGLAYSIIFRSGNFLPDYIDDAIGSNLLENLTLTNLILALIIFILGFIFYSFIAGIVGSTVSKLEELNEGMVAYNFTAIIGSYIGLGVLSAGMVGAVSSTYANFAFIFPLSSVFITPSFILLGEVSTHIALLAIVALLICIFLLMKFTARIYHTLILYSGNRIKIKDLIAIFKTPKEAR